MDDTAPPLRMKAGFIGIGAQKCATSWLHDALATHPQVATSDPKELNYFNANYERGAVWYEGKFRTSPSTVIAGEFSPNYFISRDAAERAQKYNPDMRLVALLRDPVARAFSSHLHEIRKKHIPDNTTFEAAMRDNPAYVQQSQYRANITRWLDYFPRAQLLILFAEDIADEPHASFAKIAAHLRISPAIENEVIGGRSHESVAVKSESLQNILRFSGDLARKAGAGGTVARIKSVPAIATVLKRNRTDLRMHVPDMMPETRMRLEQLFVPDMDFIVRLTGRDTLPWSAWANTNGKTASREQAL